MDKISVSTSRFKLHSIEELLARPAPKWLMEGLLTVGALVGLYGKSGGGKSFVALDWALSIAYGREWAGHAVLQGPVVYVAAEGGAALGKRVSAWRTHWGFHEESLAFFILEAVQVREPSDIEEVLTRLREREDEIRPRLIVIDTLARCFIGGDENSSKEMGEFIEGLERLRRETGATVVFVHHSGKAGTDIERGSTALRGAADAMMHVQKSGDKVTVRNNKQKDHEECPAIALRLAASGRSGDEDASCVLVLSGHRAEASRFVDGPARTTLEALATFPNGVATRKVWSHKAGMKTRTFDHHRELLAERSFIEPTGKRGEFRMTEAGRQACGVAATTEHLQVANGNMMPSPDVAATATTPVGVAVQPRAATNSGRGLRLLRRPEERDGR